MKLSKVINPKKGPSFEDYLNERRKETQRVNSNSIKDSDVRNKASRLFDRTYWLSDEYSSKDDFINDELRRLSEGDVNARLLFSKSDLKQNISESSQIFYLKKYFGSIFENGYSSLQDIEALPSSGSRAVYIKNGIISNTRPSIMSKSLDIKLVYRFYGDKSCTFYGTLKYISSKGGSQDNQFTDIKITNQEFIKSKNPDIFTLSILDGYYFSENNDSRLNEINRLYKRNRNLAVHSEDVGKFLINSIINWLESTYSEDIEKDSILKKEFDEEIDRLSKL